MSLLGNQIRSFTSGLVRGSNSRTCSSAPGPEPASAGNHDGGPTLGYPSHHCRAAPTQFKGCHRGLGSDVKPSGFQEGGAVHIEEMGTGDRGYSPVRGFGEEAGALLRGCASAPNKHWLKENDLVREY